MMHQNSRGLCIAYLIRIHRGYVSAAYCRSQTNIGFGHPYCTCYVGETIRAPFKEGGRLMRQVSRLVSVNVSRFVRVFVSKSESVC